MGVQLPINTYVVFKDKNASYYASLLSAYPLLVELLRVLPYERNIVVKARDICIYLGKCDHYSLTSMGRLLSFLEKTGLAKRLNNSRPIHYLLDHDLFTRIKLFCRVERGEDYCIESGCSLVGVCPYWKIKDSVKGVSRGDN